LKNTCKILKHVGQSGWENVEGRIPLNTINLVSGKDSSYRLKNDTLIFAIPHNDSKSFYFCIRDQKLKKNFGQPVDRSDCEVRLELKYIDPASGELAVFNKEFFLYDKTK